MYATGYKKGPELKKKVQRTKSGALAKAAQKKMADVKNNKIPD